MRTGEERQKRGREEGVQEEKGRVRREKVEAMREKRNSEKRGRF